MRPDQHKKKKNADYKTKHGIRDQKRDSDLNESGAKSANVETRTTNKNNKYSRTRKEHSSHDSDLDDKLKEGDRRSFSRHQMQSNWDRYKEEELGDQSEPNSVPSVTTIGADFKTLLEKTAGSASQFHFKGEKEWEDLNDRKDNYQSQVSPSWISVDCTTLAQALKNLPLEKRLEIDKKYFEDEHLDANTKSSLNVDNLKSPDVKKSIFPGQNVGNARQANTMTKFNFVTPDEITQKLELKDKKPLVLDVLSKLSDNQDSELNQSLKNVTCLPEEDLDQLLGLEQTGKLQDNSDQNKRHEDHGQPRVIKEDKTDVASKQFKVQQESKEDLEEWLDSILD